MPSSSLVRTLLPTGFVACALCAIGLIGYGWFLIPTVSKLSVIATSLVVTGYAVVCWYVWQRFGQHENAIHATSLALGLVAASVFIGEVLLEYVILPSDNSRMGLVEFGCVFLLYAVAGAVVTYQGCGLRAGVIAAVATAMISSLVWYTVILLVFYAYFGTTKQQMVFRAEGNYDDFARSGMVDFNAWIIEDFLGAGFFHLLLGPLIAAVLGLFGGFVGSGLRILRRPQL